MSISANRSNTAFSFFIFLSCFAFVGCSEPESQGFSSFSAYSDTVIQGRAVKGVIRNGLVQVFSISTEGDSRRVSQHPISLPVRTDQDGYYRLHLANVAQPNSIFVRITADEHTEMVCDVVSGCSVDTGAKPVPFGETFPLDSDFEMSGVLSSIEHNLENTLNLTPLSHLVVARANGLKQGLTVENIDSSYTYIETILGMESGALRHALPDLSALDSEGAISKAGLKVAVVSASFLGLLDSPDWQSISSVLDHATETMALRGSFVIANMGALPEVSVDDLYYQASELARQLSNHTASTVNRGYLDVISSEIKTAHKLVSLAPEIIDPVIIQNQPTSITVNEGSSVSLDVLATGGGGLSYQWRKDGVMIQSAHSDSHIIDSAKNDDRGVYDVIVTNDTGSIISLGALLTVVEKANTQPVANNDSATTNEDTPIMFDVLENDIDSDLDTLTIESANVDSEVGSVSILNNQLRFTPVNNYNGVAEISYSVIDGHGGIATAFAEIQVNAVNDLPEGQNDSIQTFEDTTVIVPVLDNDVDIDGDQLIVTDAVLVSGKGLVSIKASPPNSGEQYNTVVFTPEPNTSGAATIRYTLRDSNNGLSTAILSISVQPTNDVPIAVNDTAHTAENQTVIIPALINDIDADGDYLYISSAVSASGSVSINPNDTLKYEPEYGFNGVANVSYVVVDGKGGIARGTVTIYVSSVNDFPIANDDTTETPEDSPITIDVLKNDTDPDDTLLHVTGVTASSGVVSINADNTLLFIPKANFSGNVVLSYIISDGSGGSAQADVFVTVTSANDAPIAANDSTTINEDIPTVIEVLKNDTDIDGDILTLSDVEIISGGGRVAINGSKTLTFIPDAEFNGTVQLSYVVIDGLGGSATGLVSVRVNPVNDEPVLSDSSTDTDQNMSLSINALINALDVDNDPLSLISASALNGSVTLDGLGIMTYMPALNFSGEDLLSYRVGDGQGGFASAKISISVNAVPTLSSIELNWDMPEKREDGSTLLPKDISGYTIIYGTASNDLSSTIFVPGAFSLSHTVNDLEKGTYYFAISTNDSGDVQGHYSSQAIITVD